MTSSFAPYSAINFYLGGKIIPPSSFRFCTILPEERTCVLDAIVDPGELWSTPPIHRTEGQHFLDFVDDHGPRSMVVYLFSQQSGPFDKSPILFRFEQVYPESISIPVGKKGALACLPRPPQKKGIRPGFGNINSSCDISSYF